MTKASLSADNMHNKPPPASLQQRCVNANTDIEGSRNTNINTNTDIEASRNTNMNTNIDSS